MYLRFNEEIRFNWIRLYESNWNREIDRERDKWRPNANENSVVCVFDGYGYPIDFCFSTKFRWVSSYGFASLFGLCSFVFCRCCYLIKITTHHNFRMGNRETLIYFEGEQFVLISSSYSLIHLLNATYIFGWTHSCSFTLSLVLWSVWFVLYGLRVNLLICKTKDAYQIGSVSRMIDLFWWAKTMLLLLLSLVEEQCLSIHRVRIFLILTNDCFDFWVYSHRAMPHRTLLSHNSVRRADKYDDINEDRWNCWIWTWVLTNVATEYFHFQRPLIVKLYCYVSVCLLCIRCVLGCASSWNFEWDRKFVFFDFLILRYGIHSRGFWVD